MKKNLFILFSVFILFFASNVSGQPLSAYTNFQDNFMVWDNGLIRKIETLPPQKVAIGRSAIPYIDNSSNFKIYYHGGARKINSGFTHNFQVSDDLITFENARSLNVWDRGKITNLSKYSTQFVLGDSLVVFFDEVHSAYRAYYNGHVYPIESFLAAGAKNIFSNKGDDMPVSTDMQVASGQLPSLKVSDNIAAYVNYSNQFHIFYHGYILNQERYLIDNFDVGRNTVAYVDVNQEFKIFHKGKTITAEHFAPVNYSVGDNIVAYVSDDYAFKIFYKDSIYNLGVIEPDYLVRDNIVAFKNGSGRFAVFYKGEIYTIDNYYPGVKNITAGYNSLAYVNRSNVLRLFTAGKVYDVTSAHVSDWRLDYDVLQFKFGRSMYKIFYKGKLY